MSCDVFLPRPIREQSLLYLVNTLCLAAFNEPEWHRILIDALFEAYRVSTIPLFSLIPRPLSLERKSIYGDYVHPFLSPIVYVLIDAGTSLCSRWPFLTSFIHRQLFWSAFHLHLCCELQFIFFQEGGGGGKLHFQRGQFPL